MTDRLKFRLWAKDIEMYFKGALIYINTDGKLVAEDGVKVYEIDQKAYIIEQCSGLKDKKDELIYEGDIVELGGRYAKGNYKIIFDECDCEYDLKSGNGWFVYQLDSEIADNSEVIGNIHENADLLGEDK